MTSNGRPPPRVSHRLLAAVAALVLLAVVPGCSGGRHPAGAAGNAGARAAATSSAGIGRGAAPVTSTPAGTSTMARPLPGMPPPLDPHDLYAADRPGLLAAAVRGDRPLVYVPDSESDTVEEIDPAGYRVVRRFRVGRNPQHVVPSWDLRTLWVNNDRGNSLTPIDPRTGLPGRAVPVADPYNLYFTPDGRHALVMAERLRRIDIRDPHTMRLQRSIPVPCRGVNHADFSADGRQMFASCEFSGQVITVDLTRMAVVASLRLPGLSMPQDVKTAPDGQRLYVADMAHGGVWVFATAPLRRTGFVATGAGAHGLYVSRDSKVLYVTNRGEGSVSLLSFAAGRVTRTWRLPGGGSPDMGGLSADGRVLWLSGRYDGVVYALATTDGRMLRTIRVGQQPHGVCVFPQPGRYSLGHTGVFR